MTTTRGVQRTECHYQDKRQRPDVYNEPNVIIKINDNDPRCTTNRMLQRPVVKKYSKK